MRKVIALGCLLATGSVCGAVPDEAKLRDAMKLIGPATGGLGKKLKAKDATAADDAKKLQAWFANVQKFWKAKKTDDAVVLSKTAVTEFKLVSKLSAAGKWEDAETSFKKATATCAACHGTHREKAADGSWKVK
jgi:cytochrome c556